MAVLLTGWSSDSLDKIALQSQVRRATNSQTLNLRSLLDSVGPCGGQTQESGVLVKKRWRTVAVLGHQSHDAEYARTALSCRSTPIHQTNLW